MGAVLALATWLRDTPSGPDMERVLIWEEDSTRVSAVVWETENGRLEIQRRSDPSGQPFYWAVDGGPDPAEEYPVGIAGRTLVDGLSRLRVLRDLGSGAPPPGASPAGKGRLELRLGDRSRVLLVGDTTYGGEGRYAREEGVERVLVLPSSLIEPLELGRDALRERQVHRFVPGDVVGARIIARGSTVEAEKMDQVWQRAGGDGPDPVVAGLLERADQLAIAGFDLSTPVTSEPLVRVEYFGEDGRELGFVEVMREGAAYFLRSETTRVPARAVPSLAERVEQAVEELVRG